MKKIHKKLTTDQKDRGVIFTSTLSETRTENPDRCIHEVLETDDDKHETIGRLLDDKFFNDSYFNYNIIRK